MSRREQNEKKMEEYKIFIKNIAETCIREGNYNNSVNTKLLIPLRTVYYNLKNMLNINDMIDKLRGYLNSDILTQITNALDGREHSPNYIPTIESFTFLLERALQTKSNSDESTQFSKALIEVILQYKTEPFHFESGCIKEHFSYRGSRLNRQYLGNTI